MKKEKNNLTTEKKKMNLALKIFLIILVSILIVILTAGATFYIYLNSKLNKIEYRRHDIKRYDIVVVNVDGKKIIKRVIGLPNEKIEIKDNKVYADGKELDNSFASSKTDDFDFETVLGLKKIPGDSYFVLGDNREVSMDSRYSEVGTIKKEQIVGKAALIVWPLNKIKIVK